MSDSGLRPRRRETPELNVTSLIDVVLSLLLFFMLSTTFNRPSEIQINLPEAQKSDPIQSGERPPGFIEISINGNGRYFVNNIAVRDDELENVLQKAVQNKQDATVEINADAKTTHQSVITAMGAARQVGISRFAFTTIEEH